MLIPALEEFSSQEFMARGLKHEHQSQNRAELEFQFDHIPSYVSVVVRILR